jgi:hypothetical protein
VGAVAEEVLSPSSASLLEDLRLKFAAELASSRFLAVAFLVVEKAHVCERNRWHMDRQR